MAKKNASQTRKIAITSEFITLGQFLKFAGIIEQGGEAKGFLQNEEVLVNGEKEDRRGRKLYGGDVVEILGSRYEVDKS